MKEQSYTQFISESIYQFLDDEDTIDAVEFLQDPDNFRSFDVGLKEALLRKGYSDIDSPDQITSLLYEKLSAIGSTISRSTIQSWVLGTHRPKIEAGYRQQIYELCFALNLNLNETKWFFNHVYYDRAFNCHTIDEAVYLYAIKQGLSYSEANAIISKIMGATCSDSKSQNTSNYTQYVAQRIDEISDADELISFLIHNKANFNSWNQSAYQTLQDLFHKLIPTPEGKKNIDNIIRTINRKNKIIGVVPSPAANSAWGLVIQELFNTILINGDDTSDAIAFELKGVNICSNTFVLDRILNTSAGLPKNKDDAQKKLPQLPYNIIKANFPSKKTMSDVLSEEKVLQSKSYDSIRKLLVLLHFYSFWCRAKIYGNDTDEIALSDVFIDEVNDLLFTCGYERMFAGNPYDCLFLISAQADEPLKYFRDCMDLLLPDD